RARGRLKWLLIAIAVIAIVVGAIWLIRSPVLSIRAVEVTGAVRSDPADAVVAVGMGQGTPTIDVDADTILAAVAADPWVATAEVAVSWPGRVTISVTERVPFASVRSGDGWVVTGADGAVVPESGPLIGAPTLLIDTGPVTSGYQIFNPLIIGALEYTSSLPDDLRRDAVVAAEDGGLVAEVGGHTVILGRPIDMKDKATVTATLLGTGLVDGAVINVVAPLRPAVANPQPQGEGEE
ncbi:MAG: FtsQ-type POTRA domain-containing protein, partial [Acidimicrobiia bacterium]|nr:FtsQ-type POTRA domain-containing protein [Acidimicrobiia bacterium]